MKFIFAAVYALVLVTQLPHIWYAYANLERPDVALAHITAIGAAVAFELSTGVFTYRIVQGSRRKWTRPGLAFFIGASIVANGYYYGWLPFLFDWLMPVFATLALPVALALFAEEFGAEVKREKRAAKRAERRAEREAEPVQAELSGFVCDHPGCGRSFTSQNALNAHSRAHRNGREREAVDAVAD